MSEAILMLIHRLIDIVAAAVKAKDPAQLRKVTDVLGSDDNILKLKLEAEADRWEAEQKFGKR